MEVVGVRIVKPRWAICLLAADAHALGSLRLWRDVEALQLQDSLWLRSEHLQEDQWEHCRQISGAARFNVLPDSQLVPAGAIVPRGVLPSGIWIPLQQWLQIQLPRMVAAVAPPSRVPISMTRSAEIQEPSWLLADLDSWVLYAATASQARLSRWSFVANNKRQVIVRGRPLPSLPGLRLVEQNGIATPAGWTWSPPVSGSVLREVFSLAAGDYLMWTASTGWQVIADSDWVKTTRSAVRLTAETLSRED